MHLDERVPNIYEIGSDKGEGEREATTSSDSPSISA
jgi:hypothetical protein